MNRHRFNQLLNDPSLVENNDIRQLNEYRKKYPYFQGLYVIVAKALKDREHPKTDAFIKKAAIYSSNRAHLKSIIEGDDFFNQPKEETKSKEESIPLAPKEDAITASRPAQNKKPVETQEEPKTDKAEPEIAVKKETKHSIKEKTEPEQLKTSKAIQIEEKAGEPESSGDDPILDELKATKARIEALLRGELPKEEAIEEAKPIDEIKPSSAKAKTKKDSQIDIIKKFLDDDPQIDIKKKAQVEAEQVQQDLAENSLKGSDRFETETVAKLMIKQGKIQKGIGIYEKLRLKFPEKSTYFAAQIEKLKSKHNV